MMVELRLWEDKDASLLQVYADNPHIAKHMREGFPSPFTLTHAREFIHRAREEQKNLFRAICFKGKPVGSIGLFFDEDIYRKNAELAYWVAVDFQGKGIASKAIKQLTEKVFSTTSVTTIYAKPFGSNIASQKLLEKCGFTLEARLKNFIYKNNGYQDELVFILRKP